MKLSLGSCFAAGTGDWGTKEGARDRGGGGGWRKTPGSDDLAKMAVQSTLKSLHPSQSVFAHINIHIFFF